VEWLEEAYPQDGLLGEEGASKPGSSGRRWIIDPIDGTRDFLRGNRAWGVLIGLEEAGEVVAGAVYLPALDELYTARKGGGAFCNGEPIRVSSIASPQQAVICVNGINTLLEYPFALDLLRSLDRYWSVRSMGGCLDAMLLARGQADVWIEPAGKAWDFAPLKIIIEEAGGRWFNFDGAASINGGNCVAVTPLLETEARRLIRLY
jgi:histidinol-phosphatase